MKLYFVRHSESEANVKRIFSNRNLPHPLTENGRKQAQSLARHHRGHNIHLLYNSPIPRAVETAEILSSVLGIPYQTTEALREFDCGVIEGKSYDKGAARYEKVMRDWMELTYWESSIEGGESFLDMKDRFLPFIDSLVEEYSDTRTNILLIGHGGLYRCMLPLILENVSVQFAMTHPIDYTDTVIAEPRDGGLVCLSWGPLRFE
jgi:2,3-bisphosphoglycerate-dependent phosphoglycerate mutase